MRDLALCVKGEASPSCCGCLPSAGMDWWWRD